MRKIKETATANGVRTINNAIQKLDDGVRFAFKKGFYSFRYQLLESENPIDEPFVDAKGNEVDTLIIIDPNGKEHKVMAQYALPFGMTERTSESADFMVHVIFDGTNNEPVEGAAFLRVIEASIAVNKPIFIDFDETKGFYGIRSKQLESAEKHPIRDTDVYIGDKRFRGSKNADLRQLIITPDASIFED